VAGRATARYRRAQGLTVEQENAIDLLLTGATDRDVAEAVGVHRVTVTRWRNYDPHFQASLNRRRKEIWSSSTDRLRAMLPRALDRLERELEEGPGGWRVAVSLLEMTGLGSPGRGAHETLGSVGIGSTNAESIIEAEARARRPDPLDELLRGEPVNSFERERAGAELARLAAEADV